MTALDHVRAPQPKDPSQLVIPQVFAQQKRAAAEFNIGTAPSTLAREVRPEPQPEAQPVTTAARQSSAASRASLLSFSPHNHTTPCPFAEMQVVGECPGDKMKRAVEDEEGECWTTKKINLFYTHVRSYSGRVS